MKHGADVQKLRTALKELQQENEQLRQGYTSLSQQLIGLRTIQHIVQELISELDVDQLLERILRSAIHAVAGTAGSLLLLDPGRQELVFSVVEGGGGQALRGQRMGSRQGLAGWVVSHNKSLIVADVQEDQRFFEQIPKEVGFEVKSLICVPLVARGRVIGAIQVVNATHGAGFNDDDLDLLTSFAAQSATAIENARLYQALKQEHDRLIAVEEGVRKRLARGLHDGPAQLLASIIINIEFIRKLLEHDPQKVPKELESLSALSQTALRQVRTLLFDLRPVVLETQGLVPALESYVQRQQQMGGLACHLQVSGFAERLLPFAERAIFSIIQEAVGNVRRHAQAQNVWITLTKQDGNLLVQVRDDGQGFDVAELDAQYDERDSLGMLNMRERTEVIGGKLSIHSKRRAGTTVALTVPLHSLWKPDS